MYYTKRQLERSCQVVQVILTFFTVLFVIFLIMGIVELLTPAMQPETPEAWFAFNATLVRGLTNYAMVIAIFITMILIFRTIRHSETPFVPTVPRQIKLLALLMFLTSELPNWVYYILEVALTGVHSWAIISESGMLGLTLMAVIYCLAVVFDYGTKLQTEIDETI